MQLDLASWIGLALRWFHVMAAIMWIGASVYFVWLDLPCGLLPARRIKTQAWAENSGPFTAAASTTKRNI